MNATLTRTCRSGIALLALTAAGCAGDSRPAGDERWIVAIDRSASTEAPALRARQLESLDTVATQAEGRHGSLDVWAFDNDARRIFGPSPGTDGLDAVKAKELSPSATPRRITRPGLLLEKLSADPQTARVGERLRIVVLTDGGIDDAADAPRLRSACQTLAQRHPRLSLRVIGIAPESRDLWQRCTTEIADFQAVGVEEADRILREMEGDVR